MATDYQRLADEFASRIADGTLRPGDRLPTQRAYARRRGIAPSTATRVYRELVHRGLVSGEVGRGTFVKSVPSPETPALAEPADARIDLELNYPMVPGQAELLARSLEPMLRPDALEEAMRPIGVAGTQDARNRFAALAAHGDWRPTPDSILFAGNGRQATAAALAALVPAGGRLGVEALTYPVIKSLARTLGITLVPLQMDASGSIAGALAGAHRVAPLSAVYVQPREHNPLGTSWSVECRREVVQILRVCDLPVIEDAVWSFLADPTLPPLASCTPERTVLIDSLSKRIAPGLTVGFLTAPGAVIPRIADALRSTAAVPSAFAMEAAVRWIGSGVIAEVCAAKREDAAARQRLARKVLSGQAIQGSPTSYYVWWELPGEWRAEAFVAAALDRGIAVTPGSAFAADPRSTPRAVRVGLASPPIAVLDGALNALNALAVAAPMPRPQPPA